MAGMFQINTETLWTAVIVVHAVSVPVCGSLQDHVYSEEYYDYEMSPDSPLTLPDDTGDGRFVAEIACSTDYMKMFIDRKQLPKGLGIRENIVTHSSDGTMCQNTSANSTHYIHEVSPYCGSATSAIDSERSLRYLHVFALEDVERSEVRKLYSVIMDCSTTHDVGESRDWTAEYRVLEHRKSANHSKQCQLRSLCLQFSDVRGYLSDCGSGETAACACPKDTQMCSGGLTQSPKAVCMKNASNCDSVHHCLFEDDDSCGNVYGEWGSWSQCVCESGIKSRHRECKRMISVVGTRVARECAHQPGITTDTKPCNFQECIRVKCDSINMRIEIPFELGMTAESVMNNMIVSDVTDAKECRPLVNATHATFIIPLHKCNTRTWVDGDVVYYSNVVHYGAENGEDSIIIREYDHSYTARCRYQRRQTVGLKHLEPDTAMDEEVAVMAFEEKRAGLSRDAAALDTVQHFSSGDGVFEHVMEIYQGDTFSNPYNRDDYPLKKRLGERLYVSVSFISQDEDLTVFIERCIALPSSEITESGERARYLFINGGCPMDSTVQFHNQINNTFSDRFSIESFKFNDAQYPYIYFRCDVIVCDNGDDDPACRRDCAKTSVPERRKRDAFDYSRVRSQVTQGPVLVYDGDDSLDLQETAIADGNLSPQVDRISHSNAEDGTPLPDSAIVAALFGISCLTLGVALGLLLNRKKKKSNPPATTPETECRPSIIENC